MGVTTVTAARILKGQKAGRSGEETSLVMDTFPHLALSKVSTLIITQITNHYDVDLEQMYLYSGIVLTKTHTKKK